MDISKKSLLLILAAFTFTSSSAMAKDLANWSEVAKQDFKAEQCVIIPGIPGVARQCVPDTNVPYPCPTWNKPLKTCNKTVKGPCTPAIPGTKDIKKCASADRGTVSVKVDGAVSTSGSAVQVHNTVYASILGANTHFTIDCQAKADAKFKACVNLLDPTSIDYNSDNATCNIADGLPSTGLPVAADVCMFIDLQNVASTKPTGMVGAQVSAQVGMGSQTIAGTKIDLGNKSWNKTIFKVNF